MPTRTNLQRQARAARKFEKTLCGISQVSGTPLKFEPWFERPERGGGEYAELGSIPVADRLTDTGDGNVAGDTSTPRVTYK